MTSSLVTESSLHIFKELPASFSVSLTRTIMTSFFLKFACHADCLKTAKTNNALSLSLSSVNCFTCLSEDSRDRYRAGGRGGSFCGSPDVLVAMCLLPASLPTPGSQGLSEEVLFGRRFLCGGEDED